MNAIVRQFRSSIARRVAPRPLPLKVSEDRYPRIHFCHVPKCAGIAVASSIWNKVYPDGVVDRFTIELKASQSAAQALGVTMMRAREIILAYHLANPQYFFGTAHSYCSPNLVDEFVTDWNFVTMLRNPIERWISEYVYLTYKADDSWARNRMSLEEYLDSETAVFTGNSFLRYFSTFPDSTSGVTPRHVDEALETLSKFRVVGAGREHAIVMR